VIPQEIIDRVRETTDIVETVSRYVSLKSSGRSYKGLCPFHQEKTPSFIVNPERQIFKCFGCGAGGNAFHFLMRIENWTFIEAIRDLAKRSGIALPEAGAAVDESKDRERRRLYEVLAWAAARFRKALESPKFSGPAKTYLGQRGVSEELCGRFGLGFAPQGWDNLLKAARRDHYSEELLAQAGLISRKNDGPGVYDRFRERVIFPIRDVQGRPVAFGGRLLRAGEPKYLNSPETEVFHKGEILYGLDLAREAARKVGRLVLVEGYMDVIACHAAGVTEAVATMGTALTPQQAHLLRRYADKLILIYDADEAGIRASLRAFEILKKEKLAMHVVSLPGAKDPDEFIGKFGAAAFQTALERAEDMVMFVLNVALAKHDSKTIEGKVAVIKQVVPFVALLKDNLVEEQVRRQEYAKLLAERLRLDEAQVARIIREEVGRQSQNASDRMRTQPEAAEDWVQRLQPRVQTRAEEEILLASLLRFPRLIEPVREQIEPELFFDPHFRTLAAKLLAAEPADPNAEEVWLPRFLGELSDPVLADTVAGLTASEMIEAEDEYSSAADIAKRAVGDCLRRMEAARLREWIGQVQWQIREADQNGELETLKQLQQQEIEWKNRLKRLGVDWKPGKTGKK